MTGSTCSRWRLRAATPAARDNKGGAVGASLVILPRIHSAVLNARLGDARAEGCKPSLLPNCVRPSAPDGTTMYAGCGVNTDKDDEKSLAKF